jgi:4-carboxymuconolactone decarboxylase
MDPSVHVVLIYMDFPVQLDGEEIAMTGQLMEQDARPSGLSVKERVVGGGAPSQADPFLAPFFETASEHVWGGVWNRPGLELKYRSLVVVSVLAATGHANAELKTHLRGALNLGWTTDELREALLQIGGYAGFPAAHEALDVLSELVAER